MFREYFSVNFGIFANKHRLAEFPNGCQRQCKVLLVFVLDDSSNEVRHSLLPGLCRADVLFRAEYNRASTTGGFFLCLQHNTSIIFSSNFSSVLY